jgi:RimJ/RimL family protein N-acetyltransferase
MTELTDVPGAFGYGDAILVGDRVRLRSVRDDDLPALAKREMDPGRMATLSNWVAPPSEAPAKERIARWSANQEDDLGFAIETLEDPPVLVGSIHLWGAHPKDRCATLGVAPGRDYLGRGYGTDAVRVIVGYGFREMGLHRIQLSVAPFNPAGIRAYEKAGFVEGRPPSRVGAARRALVRRGADYVHPRPRVGGPVLRGYFLITLRDNSRLAASRGSHSAPNIGRSTSSFQNGQSVPVLSLRACTRPH